MTENLEMYLMYVNKNLIIKLKASAALLKPGPQDFFTDIMGALTSQMSPFSFVVILLLFRRREH